jgi:predicted phage replisome organizer
MADSKRFYWLKLKEDFFRQKEIKKLRKLAGGDTYTVIYLKMLLRSLKDGGRLYYEGIEENFPAELALDIDEDEDNVKMAVAFLLANNILTQNQPDEYELLTAHEMTDSECDSAARVRRLRDRKALLCNGTVTERNVEIEKDIEKDIEIEKEVKKKRKRFSAPTVDEVEAYAKEKGYTNFSAQRFVDYYESKGWVVGKSPMKDWKAAVRGWVAREGDMPQGRSKEWHNPALDYAQRDYTGTKPKPERVYMTFDDEEG